MDTTTEISQSFEKLFALSKSLPDMETLCHFDAEIKYLARDIADAIQADATQDYNHLRHKIKELITSADAFLVKEEDETDDEKASLKQIVRTHLLSLKVFTRGACLSLPEHLSFLREICVKPETDIQQHLDKIGKEFRKLSCRAAKENLFLNRYSNSLPYDDYRVMLKSGRYISATDAHFDDKRYLIASAPFRAFMSGKRIDTLEDWWRMILECDTRLIVMTTNVFENRSKCHDYFRSQDAVTRTLGDLNDEWECVSVKTSKVGSRNQESIFKRTIVMSGPDDELREITHLQYCNWPDFGAADPKLFLKFWQTIMEEESLRSTKDHPPLFHCSAGLGRTGTTLTLHFLLSHLDDSRDPLNEAPDIDACIHSLRSQRNGLVSSAVQYKFIARVLIEYFRQKIDENQSEIV